MIPVASGVYYKNKNTRNPGHSAVEVDDLFSHFSSVCLKSIQDSIHLKLWMGPEPVPKAQDRLQYQIQRIKKPRPRPNLHLRNEYIKSSKSENEQYVKKGLFYLRSDLSLVFRRVSFRSYAAHLQHGFFMFQISKTSASLRVIIILAYAQLLLPKAKGCLSGSAYFFYVTSFPLLLLYSVGRGGTRPCFFLRGNTSLS